MKWSIQELRIKARDPLKIETSLEMEEDLKARNQDILSASPVSVDGIILYEDHTVLVQLDVTVDLILPSTRSLDPVQKQLDFPIRERYIEKDFETDIEDDDSTLQLPLDSDTIDLDRAVLENVILNIPSRILTPEEANGKSLPSGNGWQLLTEDIAEDNPDDETAVDPRLSPLKDFFKDQDE